MNIMFRNHSQFLIQLCNKFFLLYINLKNNFQLQISINQLFTVIS
jgi:hypothetical protein